MSVLTWLMTALNLVILFAFVWALISLRRLPTGQRPEVTCYSRTGTVLRVGQIQPPKEAAPDNQDGCGD
jgi:hypothetical protein